MGAKSAGLLRTALPPLIALAVAAAPGLTQSRDTNAPYEDAYDVLHGDDLVGEWQGTVSGSSVSQGERQIGGQAKFVKRGYEGKESFGLVLHDQRNRDGLEFSEISIGSIPCGPDPRQSPLVHGLELQDAPPGSATLLFQNVTAKAQPGMQVHPGYAPTAEKPATLQTRWTDDGLSLTVSGELKSVVAPVRGATFDYERQGEGRLDTLKLNLELVLARTHETEDLYQATLCDEPEHFEVLWTDPLESKENIALSGAWFDVEFTEALHEGSFSPATVMMMTRDPDNGYIYVDADYSLEGRATLRITPNERLRSGTIYEIVIAGDRDGVVGLDGETLEEDYEFSFSTMVDPEHMRLDLYQVSRNSPLVHGKPAAARIYVDWEELDDIHPDWQVTDYPVEADVRDEHDNIIFPMQSLRAVRPDQFDDEDRRLGNDSLNLFDWTPRSSRTTSFVANVLPEDHYPQEIELEPERAEREMDYAEEHVGTLTFDYFIAEHSEWLENGAPGDAIQQVHNSVEMERRFANQILPVSRVQARYRGRFRATDTICSIAGLSAVICDENEFNNYRGASNPLAAAKAGDWGEFLKLFNAHVSASSNADILVSYHPPSLQGGQASSVFEQPETLKRGPGEVYGTVSDSPHLTDLMRADGSTRNMIAMGSSGYGGSGPPAILRSPLVVHEFGHIFALPHIPYADGKDHRREICKSGYQQTARSIDGMRIDLNGDDGEFKSSEKGNSETTAPLLNLMFPCLWEPRTDYWIDSEQYEWLIERLPGILGATRTRHTLLPDRTKTRHAHRNLLWKAAFTAEPDAEPQNWLMVSGLVQGDTGGFLPTVRAGGPRQRLSSAEGPYEIRVEDKDGRVLARASAGPEADGSDSWAFAVTLPVSGKPKRIVLSRDGRVIAERRALAGLAPPRITSHQVGSVYRAGEQLEWQAEASADGLTYSVRFSADGEAWSTLAVLLPEPSFTPDPAALTPGPDATFEIIVQDGVGQQSTVLPVSMEVPLEPLATLPVADQSASKVTAAEFLFNVEIDPETLSGVRLLGPSGDMVPSHVRLDPSGMVVVISPAEHEAAAQYTAIVPTSLKAKDGRALGKEWRLPFRMAAQAQAWPEAASAIAETGRLRRELPRPPAGEEPPSGPDRPVGEGEITLQLGQAITLPARILSCTTGAGVQSAELDFSTNPDVRQQLKLERSASGQVMLKLDQGRGQPITGHGSEGDDWALVFSNETVSGRGVVLNGSMSAGVQFRGECPIS